MGGRFTNFPGLNVSKSFVRNNPAFKTGVDAAFVGFVGVTEGVVVGVATSAAPLGAAFVGVDPSIASNKLSTSFSMSILDIADRSACVK